MKLDPTSNPPGYREGPEKKLKWSMWKEMLGWDRRKKGNWEKGERKKGEKEERRERRKERKKEKRSGGKKAKPKQRTKE